MLNEVKRGQYSSILHIFSFYTQHWYSAQYRTMARVVVEKKVTELERGRERGTKSKKKLSSCVCHINGRSASNDPLTSLFRNDDATFLISKHPILA